jgi:hypothetical protein
VEVEARVLLEPGLEVGVFVGAVVVDDQVQLSLAGEDAVEGAQEGEELLVAVAGQALADDPALQDLEGGKKRGRAVALVVVGHRAGPAPLHRQARLGAVECLDLAFLVDAEHDRLLGWVEVEANDVGQLLGEARVVGELERPDPVRSQPVGVPDPLHGCWADPLGLGRAAAAPVRLTRRLGLGCRLHDRLDLRRRDRCLRPRPGFVSVKAAVPPSAKRERHKITVGRDTPSARAIALFDSPSPASKAIRARSATLCGVFCAPTQRSKIARWSSEMTASTSADAMPGTLPEHNHHVKLF